MTLTEVFDQAGTMTPATRLEVWLACGGDHHPLQDLQQTTTGGSPPPYYCTKCWTAFRPDGSAINPPFGDV